MSYFSRDFEKLISELSQLPGVGTKSATRLAFHIINLPKEQINSLSDTIKNVGNNIKRCSICNTLTDSDICPICKDEHRNKKIIMVLENERDMLAYDQVGEYKGLFHILGGAISPMMGIGPDDLNIKNLLTRLTNVDEVILATNQTIEGEATATYLTRLIKPMGIKITKIASGVPAGGDIENIDQLTLLKAYKGRVEL